MEFEISIETKNKIRDVTHLAGPHKDASDRLCVGVGLDVVGWGGEGQTIDLQYVQDMTQRL